MVDHNFPVDGAGGEAARCDGFGASALGGRRRGLRRWSGPRSEHSGCCAVHTHGLHGAWGVYSSFQTKRPRAASGYQGPCARPVRVYMSCRVSRSLREGGIVRTRDGTAPCPGVLAAEVAGVAAGVAATEALTSAPTTRSTKRFMVS